MTNTKEEEEQKATTRKNGKECEKRKSHWKLSKVITYGEVMLRHIHTHKPYGNSVIGLRMWGWASERMRAKWKLRCLTCNMSRVFLPLLFIFHAFSFPFSSTFFHFDSNDFLMLSSGNSINVDFNPIPFRFVMWFYDGNAIIELTDKGHSMVLC